VDWHIYYWLLRDITCQTRINIYIEGASADLGWPIIMVDAFFVCEDTVFTLKNHFHLRSYRNS